MNVVCEKLGLYSESETLAAETNDWQHVESIDWGGGYDWEEFHAFYSPSARRFFWASGRGCSCDYIGMSYKTVGDFENGGKSALVAAITRFADHSYRQVARDVIDAHRRVQQFHPAVS